MRSYNTKVGTYRKRSNLHVKRKRRKTSGLSNPEESGGRPVFFSPAKVELLRQRQMDKAQADEQRKQAIQDRRLKITISREEKAREYSEKKKQRAAMRQAL